METSLTERDLRPSSTQHIDGYAALIIYHTEHKPCSMLRPPTCRAFVQVTWTIYLYLQARKASQTLYVNMHHKFLMHGPRAHPLSLMESWVAP
jgi:hypothetical protein